MVVLCNTVYEMMEEYAITVPAQIVKYYDHYEYLIGSAHWDVPKLVSFLTPLIWRSYNQNKVKRTNGDTAGTAKKRFIYAEGLKESHINMWANRFPTGIIKNILL